MINNHINSTEKGGGGGGNSSLGGGSIDNTHETTTTAVALDDTSCTTTYAQAIMNSIDCATSSGETQQQTDNMSSVQIVDVWSDNLIQEMNHIAQLFTAKEPKKDDQHIYNCIAIDTEFPGVVYRANPYDRTASFYGSSPSEFHYQALRQNVNAMKLIQLGICFTDEQGRYPPDGRCCWQFNFQFDLKSELYAQNSIDLLSSSGMDFERHYADGIDPKLFAELFTALGLLLNDRIKWLSFHGAYDFAYLLKLISGVTELPKSESDFFHLLSTYFPKLYDIKYMTKSIGGYGFWRGGGLNQLASELSVTRAAGATHQAGSDSLLTSAATFRLLEYECFDLTDDSFSGVLYGLGRGYEDPRFYSGCWSPPSPGSSRYDTTSNSKNSTTTRSTHLSSPSSSRYTVTTEASITARTTLTRSNECWWTFTAKQRTTPKKKTNSRIRATTSKRSTTIREGAARLINANS